MGNVQGNVDASDRLDEATPTSFSSWAESATLSRPGFRPRASSPRVVPTGSASLLRSRPIPQVHVVDAAMGEGDDLHHDFCILVFHFADLGRQIVEARDGPIRRLLNTSWAPAEKLSPVDWSGATATTSSLDGSTPLPTSMNFTLRSVPIPKITFADWLALVAATLRTSFSAAGPTTMELPESPWTSAASTIPAAGPDVVCPHCPL